MLVAQHGKEEYEVSCAFLVMRTRSDLPYDFFSGERRDVLRAHGNGFRLARRKVLIDQTILKSYNLSVFFEAEMREIEVVRIPVASANASVFRKIKYPPLYGASFVRSSARGPMQCRPRALAHEPFRAPSDGKSRRPQPRWPRRR